jgi:phenylpropionate dioxygenase-like ring-hydroxylating dioxygenase large terminal subunit
MKHWPLKLVSRSGAVSSASTVGHAPPTYVEARGLVFIWTGRQTVEAQEIYEELTVHRVAA